MYVCDECTGLWATIVVDTAGSAEAEAAPWRSQHYERSAEDILALLPALFRSAGRVERELTDWISLLRERGIGRPTIADAAGIGLDADAVRRRFGSSSPE